jgi:putative membrane protein
MTINKPYQWAAAMVVAAAWCGTALSQTGTITPSDRTGTQQRQQDREPSSAQPRQDRDQSAQQSRQRSEQRDTTARRDAKADVSRADRRFIQNAMQHGMAEVEMANMAVNKASSDQVKKFAQQMAQDHGKANDELKRLAAANNVTITADLDRSDERRLKDLDKASGAEFDRKFMTEMVKAHERDLKDFQKAAKDARDPQLKSFAEKTAQSIEEHLQHARPIASAVGVKGERTAARRSDRERDAATGSTARRDETRARTDTRDTTGRPDDNRARDAATGTTKIPPRSGTASDSPQNPGTR